MNTAKRLMCTSVLLTLSLTACGGGGGGAAPSSAMPGGPLPQVVNQNGGGSTSTLGSATIVIGPAKAATAHGRSLKYFAPSTASAVIATTAQNGSTSSLTVACNGSCSASLQLPVGQDTITVSLYDGANGGGTLVARGSTSTNILAGVNNTVSMVLGGVIASLTVLPQNALTPGTSGTTAVTVQAKDADGSVIIGPYTSTVSLAVSDPALGISPSSVSDSSSAITLSYNGSAQFTGGTISASAPGITAASAKVVLQTLNANLPSEKPVAADALADSVGVDAHFDGFGQGSPYDTQYAKAAQYLWDSGIRHVRDDVYLSKFDANALFYSHGIHNSVGAGHSMIGNGSLQAHVAANPQADLVECDNEADGWDSNWIADDRACQQWLYSTVKSSYPQLAVVSPSVLNMWNTTQLGDVSQYVDYGSMHYGPAPRNPGNTGFGDCFSWAAPQSGSGCTVFGTLAFGIDAVQRNNVGWSKPVMATEISYDDHPGAGSGNYVGDAQQALYFPRYFLLAYAQGIIRSYVYQFCNMSAQDQSFGYEGLLDDSANPKPQYYAIKSFVQFLSDQGGTFSTTALPFSLSGDANTRHMLMQKRNGTYILAVWEERQDWNNSTNSPASFPNVPVTLTLASPKTVTAYTFNANGTLQSAPVSGTNAVYPISSGSAVTFVQIN